MQFHTAAMVAFLVAGVLLLAATSTRAAPSYESERLPNIDDYVLQMLRKSYELENVKRGLDLGFDRGYSGTKAAKYLTGLELAGPMGPGRKRRSDENGFNNQLATYMAENSKRGLDLGFGRGFSGMQAARHLIGLEEANDARGPGRRRRSVSSDNTDEAS